MLHVDHKLIARLAGIAGTLILSIILVSSCSPSTRYKTLSFFFDGVPNPNAPSTGDYSTNERGSNPDVPFARRAPAGYGRTSIHKPYRKMQCASCHHTPQAGRNPKGMQSLLKTRIANGLCQECHKKIPDEVPYVHAPALVNACNECHHHHQSRYKTLLLKGGDDLCYRCHRKEDLSEGSHHAKPLSAARDHDTTCVHCHNPHHGKKRFFLRNMKKTDKSESKASNATGPAETPDVKTNK